MINSRALLIVISMFLFFAALIVKLVDIQIVKSEELKYFANKQQVGVEKIPADRGLVYDRNNVLLEYNRHDISFYADLRMVSNKSKIDIAEKFSLVFGKRKTHYLNLLSGKGKTICLEKKASSEKAIQLIGYKKIGLFYREDPTRVYHYDNLASHVLGYVNTEYKGLTGVAQSFNTVLKGEEGLRIVEKNAIGDLVSIEDRETKPAIPGNNLYLTIDKSYQSILEEELKNGLKEYGGSSAIGIIMDPNTGELLALANADDFNPNEYWKFNDDVRRNKALTDTYEPGSTFKVITFASLIDQKLCSLHESIYVENGNYRFKRVNIKDNHPHSHLTTTQVLEQSSNIGVAKLVQRIDDETYYKYLRGFGFGYDTSVQLPGEASGLLRKPNQWSALSKTYLSFGYEISVTPIQLIAAFSSIINGGILYQPQIIKRQVRYDGSVVYDSSPKEVRRVISEETSRIMRNLLSNAVIKGTGKNANSELISIGGKTGTSQKLVDGRYSRAHYNSSFVGFFPVDNPKVAMLILVNSPNVGKYGGLVAAPIFKNVAERIVSNHIDDFEKHIPDERIIQVKYMSNQKQKDSAYDRLRSIEINDAVSIADNCMPDLSNVAVRDAINILTQLGVKYKINGSGIIFSQSISPGKKLSVNEICVLNCTELTVRGASVY
ncbi:MAG: transpeptidase family protein [Ignavibacteriaceae bacterium]|nr:transpeptidase family protein [Ignavibacteriaceae bacterium]